MKRIPNPMPWYYQEKKQADAVKANLVDKFDGTYKPEPFNDHRPGARDHMAVKSLRGLKEVNQYDGENLRSKD